MDQLNVNKQRSASVLPLGSSETSLISHRRARDFVALLEVEFEKALSPSAHRHVRPRAVGRGGPVRGERRMP